MNETSKLYNIFLSKDDFYTPINNSMSEYIEDKSGIIMKNLDAEDVYKIWNNCTNVI